ncbi:MAG: YHS domain protein [Deltaproteobacteria bacterium HGW-Deltaproteobacteria-6]|jgi:YHS domain-containing protein|nr:MAG: YHS domain protein [Deltaproteobacteria bacterium HGW-Deltaproteobacteria-6]
MKLQKAIDKILMISSFVFLSLTGAGGTAAGMAWMDDAAISGYDAVSYFTAGKPVKGSASFTYKWHGLTWHFSTKENLDLFTAGPEKYAPQYDGYCAWAMSQGRQARTDPDVWQMVDGKLYLNCSRSAHEKWSRDIPGHIRKADVNWVKFSGGK